MAPTDRVRRQVKGRGVQGGKLRDTHLKRRALSEMSSIPILDILSNGSLLFYPAISSIAMDRTRTEEVILDGGYAEAFAYGVAGVGSCNATYAQFSRPSLVPSQLRLTVE